MKTIIVARYNEDTSWVDEATNWNPLIVQKDVDLPNIGREPTSYLHAIIKLYDGIRPSDQFCFVQGEPFTHCPDILQTINRSFYEFTPLTGGLRIAVHQADGSRKIFEEPFESDGEGLPHHPGVPVKDCYERWIGEFPGSVSFHPGCQFLITGREILAHPKDYYEQIYQDIMAGDDLMPYAFERLVGQIFTK